MGAQGQKPVVVNDLVIQNDRPGWDDVFARGSASARSDLRVEPATRYSAAPRFGTSAAPRRDLIRCHGPLGARPQLGSYASVTIGNISARNVLRDVAAGCGGDAK